MADEIQGQVKDAVRDRLEFWGLTYPQDDFIGFGYRILDRDQLREIAARPFGRQSFTTRIKNSVQILNRVLSYGYEIFGATSATDDTEPPGEGNAGYEIFQLAIGELKAVKERVHELERQLQETPKERREMIAELLHLRREVQPRALEQLTDARVAYQRSRNENSADLAGLAGPTIPVRARQLREKCGRLFARKASVAPPNLVNDDGGDGESSQ